MILKKLGVAAALLLLALSAAFGVGQTAGQTAPANQAAPSSRTSAAPKPPASGAQPASSSAVPAASPATPSGQNGPGAPPANCQGSACDASLPHITIATPAPAPAPWPLQDRISWAANLILVLIAYVGIIFALSLLRKIERQTRINESVAQSAAESAKAALMYAEAQAQAQRPWLVVMPEQVPGTPDCFTVVATNRGRSPTRIVTLVDDIAVVPDETHLPAAPTFASEPHPPRVPIILLPGESTGLKTFRREDVKSVCPTEEDERRIDAWEQKIYLFGNITYVDVRAPEGMLPYETAWCCWYIHGHQKSGMVVAGPIEYNRHT